MAGLGASEMLIILAVVMLLFGSAKLPQLARSLGRSARILRTETQGLHDDEPADRPPEADPRPPAGRQGALPPARPPRPSSPPAEHRETGPAR
ncbi:twin-arginine translocase TatA/TatE family subunit [Actinomadura sp. WMMA1423]|uniref:twin-arginine translocase TatA/TatE family subunit n=1 Tax=Actinomadura sp. WMMA1423 TaxID=2591108 RepID=UPI0011470897|nr:twin-arginine translocase TatA/TatE family subunit [Actinomadura sp. WMMA1423]